MIRKRLEHIVRNCGKKAIIYDYGREPRNTVLKGKSNDAIYVARPIFNSIRVGEEKSENNSVRGYQKYKIRNSKNRLRKIDDTNKMQG